MNKKFLSIIILFIILNFILSGCISTNNNQEKILGSWITEKSFGQEETAVFNFFSNGTFSFVVTVLLNESDVNVTRLSFWGPYQINDEKIKMEIEGNMENLEFSFSDDFNVLTLFEDNDESTVLLRQLNN